MFDTKKVFSSQCTLFPGLGTSGSVLIPQEARTSVAPVKSGAHRVPWGALNAVGAILLGYVQATRHGETLVLEASRPGKASERQQAHRDGNQVTWTNAGEVSRPYQLLIGEALMFGLHPVLQQSWSNMLDAGRATGLSFPTRETDLELVSHDPTFKLAVFNLVDTLYYVGKDLNRAEVAVAIPEPQAWSHTPVFWGGQPLRPGAMAMALTPEGRLARRAMNGVRALLVGPTGTGKTEMAKRVALTVGAAMVNIKGRPGLEDRDMIGFISVTATGPCWVDGPLARAMRRAQAGERTVLIVDELLRLDAYHRNVFIGMLDDVSAVELKATLNIDAPDGRYYTLDLPGSGEVLYANTALLSVICTTNAGGNYTQSGEIDPALLRRFQRVMQVSYPEEKEILPVYVRACSPSTARVAYALEVASRAMTQVQGQLLARPMNIGVTLNYLAEVRDLLDGGMNETDALREALEVTVLPFCVELTGEGELDGPAADSMRKTLEKFFRQGITRAA